MDTTGESNSQAACVWWTPAGLADNEGEQYQLTPPPAPPVIPAGTPIESRGPPRLVEQAYRFAGKQGGGGGGG